ncbi:class I SAM-dependent methyltransferase [Anabaena azotica]|uniref:DUF938 domain-containing protein n=1 Tax=Anabaena azotica FACHB-119 TaxID=947527 RepID=A0ABR8CZU8_9NOST|nr:class I SAM-dependent methyltransferase [Anabaena azotica]MBD2499476.1 DUF938 domain-containing protein [Anabaena azotica FACHB-119]
MNTPPDPRKYAPATQRNREPILEVLLQVLPASGTILEIASGTGEHAIFFAPRLSPRQWLPSDPNPELRASITAWTAQFPADNLYPPLELDASQPIWPVELDADLPSPIVAIVNINMIHISPWSACLGLMAGAGRILPPGGILYLYGPYKQGTEHTAPSNATFDQSLRSQNPDWGVRNLEDVVAAAQEQNLQLQKVYQMPANNLSVVFQLCV